VNRRTTLLNKLKDAPHPSDISLRREETLSEYCGAEVLGGSDSLAVVELRGERQAFVAKSAMTPYLIRK
jgi:hypothetical protein